MLRATMWFALGLFLAIVGGVVFTFGFLGAIQPWPWATFAAAIMLIGWACYYKGRLASRSLGK